MYIRMTRGAWLNKSTEIMAVVGSCGYALSKSLPVQVKNHVTTSKFRKTLCTLF